MRKRHTDSLQGEGRSDAQRRGNRYFATEAAAAGAACSPLFQVSPNKPIKSLLTWIFIVNISICNSGQCKIGLCEPTEEGHRPFIGSATEGRDLH